MRRNHFIGRDQRRKPVHPRLGHNHAVERIAGPLLIERRPRHVRESTVANPQTDLTLELAQNILRRQCQPANLVEILKLHQHHGRDQQLGLLHQSRRIPPQAHAAVLLLVAYLTRGAACVVPESGGFDPAEMIPLINRFGGARFFAAPTMVKRFVESPEIGTLEVPRLDTIVYGGGPMYVSDTRRALDTLGPRLWQIYGQGETPCTISYLSRELHAASDHPRFLERLASVGMARTGIALRVVDEEFRPLPPGEVGEIIVRGETVMRGYWDNPQASAQALHDGWLKTGDLGFLDREGLLTLKDRSKDLIISGGSNIYPREVEELLQSHPGVREVAVIGVPHAEWGEEPVAYVVMHDGHAPDATALEQVCLDNMARFKRPKRYVFVAELPKNNYGKILKTELRAWATQAGDTLA